MVKKKSRKHLQFYIDCMRNGKMPYWGLCACSKNGLIDYYLLTDFRPATCIYYSYWASGDRYDRCFKFTPLRQTIVLLMACLNNEL